MADFSFIEYTYNPYEYTSETMEQYLTSLRYVKRTVNRSQTVSMWNHDLSIIMLREIPEEKTGLSGIGFFCNQETFEKLDYVFFDQDVNSHVSVMSNGLRLVLLDVNHNSNSNFQEFTPVNENKQEDPYIHYNSGIVTSGCDNFALEGLDFKVNSYSEDLNIFTSNNKRFTLINYDQPVFRNNILICETKDVFKATSALSAKDHTLKYVKNNNDFGSLTYKINSYNCSAFGNDKSYSIEQYVCNGLPNLDIILRMRKQYLTIKPHNLETYNECISEPIRQ